MERTILGTTADNKNIYLRVDMDKETAMSHIHCEMELLQEALSKIAVGNENFIRQTITFDREIATDRCVEIDDTDDVIMWQRPGRAGKTPMVLDREPEPTSEMLVVLCYDGDDLHEYVLITAFTGTDAPQEPWDPHCREKEASEEFWATHALVPTEEEAILIKASK